MQDVWLEWGCRYVRTCKSANAILIRTYLNLRSTLLFVVSYCAKTAERGTQHPTRVAETKKFTYLG